MRLVPTSNLGYYVSVGDQTTSATEDFVNNPDEAVRHANESAEYGNADRVYGGQRQVTLASSVRRHWFITLLPAILLVAAGIVVGAKKQPTYSTTATINVGKSDINTQATPGYETAAEALASTYSRLVTSQHVAIPAARAVHQSSAVVGGELSSVPIPNEPTFTITATGSSPQAAIALDNAAVQAVINYANNTQTQGGGPSQLLAQYTAALTRAANLQNISNTLQGRLSAQQAAQQTAQADGSTPSTLPWRTVTPAQATNAKVASQIASLQAEALANQYSSLVSNGTAPTLDVLINPTGATSNNRLSNVEKYAVVGGVAGIMIGISFVALISGIGAGRRRDRLVPD